MARARKLFPVYGSALANNMLAAIERGRVVGDFVARYVREYDRRGILGGSARDQELTETIGREMVLTMIVEVRRVLPRFFGSANSSKLKLDDRAAIDAFVRELNAALERAWNLQGDDRSQFRRDLDLYSQSTARQGTRMSMSKRGKAQREDPPFVARVALLLDPSMLDQARRATRKFHAEAQLLGQKILRQTLRPAR